MTFEKIVTGTVDPANTRDGSNAVRSSIFSDNCAFNGGLTTAGDDHATVSPGGGRAFENGAVVTWKGATSSAPEEIPLEDNLIAEFWDRSKKHTPPAGIAVGGACF